ncbi:hypothetical protein B5F07_02735 [Lachnoclostridium sp. An169]|nr:hypothetical protein B5F07_02735 [Lachnoclostridium sp. An169]
MHLPFPGEKFVGKAIGAPLLSVFRETCGLTEEQAAEAVKFYREYYASKGKSEADVYDGISENLKALKENHILLGANSHFPRPAGPHFPASQGHIKRPA